MKLKALKKLLETPFWPKGLDAMSPQCRTQDDHEGSLGSGVRVTVSMDGDAWIQTFSPESRPHTSCRYRPLQGGGHSPRTRQALLILALAIKLDNKEDGR